MYTTLSVIVPAYNAEETVAGCLQSILDGCGEDVEVLVVDDGSTDETVLECKSIGSQLVSVYSQANAGVSSARNKGLELASGDYVMFVDADDKLVSDWHTKVAPFLASGEDAVVFMDGLMRERYEIDEIVGSIVGVSPRVGAKPGKMPMKWASSPVSRIYSRRFLKTGGITFDPRVINGEDALFNLEVFLKTRHVKFISQSIYRYRIHSGSATHTFDRAFFGSNEAYLIRLEELLVESGLYASEQISSLVDFSFCRSMEVMALRAAWAGNAQDRRNAVSEVNASSLVRARLCAGTDIGRNLLHERIIFALARAGRFDFAILILLAVLKFKKHGSDQERWVNI